PPTPAPAMCRARASVAIVKPPSSPGISRDASTTYCASGNRGFMPWVPRAVVRGLRPPPGAWRAAAVRLGSRGGHQLGTGVRQFGERRLARLRIDPSDE